MPTPPMPVQIAYAVPTGKVRIAMLLTAHVADHLGMFIYYGNRRAQPERARAFIEMAILRLQGNASFELTANELALAEAKELRTLRAATQRA